MENVQTAEELLSNNFEGLKEVINDDDLFFFYKAVVCEFAKEFAKLHVEAALKEASKNAKCSDDAIVDLGHTIIDAYVEKDSILKAYPLTNIK